MTLLLTWVLRAALAVHADPPNLILEISAESLALRVGEFPKVEAVITNRGLEPVVLVLPGDGSVDGRRTPVISWKISVLRQDKSDDKRRGFVMSCPSMNALRPQEVFTLWRGESRSLGAWVGMKPFWTKGSYAALFTYRNDPGLKWQSDPDPDEGHDPEAMRRVHSSTACELESNSLIFDVQ